ncbi:ATP-dependent helicase [Lapidilactobacillus wuchangensis]|uniref:ATP-dependent helicase n=1 Tax=Lapidilactobacillus wuchangensis TaxID=2486001 RepID=UPI000F7A7344|nr:ATP-dependent helicase [Lapidilactobacillus wuchangensis]
MTLKKYELEKEEIIAAVNNLEKKEIKVAPFAKNYHYLDSLDEMQKVAATRLEGNYLVIAGPGAGKTHTLVYRVFHMIKMGIPAKEICLITFTRKAANQLKRRLEELLPKVEIGYIGTIHGLAFLLIRRSLSPGVRLLDPEDDRMIMRLAMEEHSLKLPERTRLTTVQKIIDYSSVTLKSIDEALIDLNKEDINSDDIKRIMKVYEKYKKQYGYINFNDAILLASGADRGSLNYLMVDEYQDTDPLQIQMIKGLAFPNVMAVGDDFQSIYSFRGADNKIILNFDNDFENAKVIKLNINYRSTREIVDLENQITGATEYGYRKALKANRKTGSCPVTFPESSDTGVSEVMTRVRKLIEEESDDKLAVIYRYNRRKVDFESNLIKNKIDYVVYGGIKLLERKHIKDICAILLTNQNKNDFIAYMRALMLLEGIGEVSAKQLIQGLKKSSRTDFLELKQIINTQYPSTLDLLKDTEKFYLDLESVLSKSNYTVEEIQADFEILNELSKDYQSINNFISDIILDSSQDKWSSKKSNVNVVLTTIHSAKGLEFDDVFFIYDPEIVYSVDKAEENRRLFYTAISRAKTRLTIIDGGHRKDISQILSDFEVQDMYLDPELLEDEAEITDTNYLNVDDVENSFAKNDVRQTEMIQKNWTEIINSVANSEHRMLLTKLQVAASSEDTLLLVYDLDDEKIITSNSKQLTDELQSAMTALTDHLMSIILIEQNSFQNIERSRNESTKKYEVPKSDNIDIKVLDRTEEDNHQSESNSPLESHTSFIKVALGHLFGKHKKEN